MSTAITRPLTRRRSVDGSSAEVYFYWWLAGVASTALFLRLVGGTVRPGEEFDESTYVAVSKSMATGHGMNLYAGDGSISGPWFFHPPFHFVLLGAWMRLAGESLHAARLWAVLCSTAAIVLIAVATRRLSGSALGGLLAGLLLACDPWLIYENRVAWLENSLMIVVALTLLAWASVLRTGSWRSWIRLGLSLGSVCVFKYDGGMVLFAAVVVWVLVYRRVGRALRGGAVALGCVAVVLAAYGWVAFALYGSLYSEQSYIQFQRASGAEPSNGRVGLGNSTAQILIKGHYTLFIVTALLMLGTVAAIAVRAFRWLRSRGRQSSPDFDIVLAVYSLTAVFVLAVAYLRYPHYTILAWVPSDAFMGVVLARLFERSATRQTSRAAVATLTCTIVVAGAVCGMGRIFYPAPDAIGDAIQYIDSHGTTADTVIADDPISLSVNRGHCSVINANQCNGYWTWVVTYQSNTQTILDIPAYQSMIREGIACSHFKGFRDEVVVYHNGPCPTGPLINVTGYPYARFHRGPS